MSLVRVKQFSGNFSVYEIHPLMTDEDEIRRYGKLRASRFGKTWYVPHINSMRQATEVEAACFDSVYPA